MKRIIKKQQGITLLEIMITMGIITVLILASMILIDPPELRTRGRDEKRLAAIRQLESVINEFKIDNSRYPDLANTLRTSTTLPAGSSGPAENIEDGWIAQDLSFYIIKWPIDPLNNADFYYSYQHNGLSYEINVRLEYYTDYALNSYDGGNDDFVYEVGDVLTIL